MRKKKKEKNPHSSSFKYTLLCSFTTLSSGPSPPTLLLEYEGYLANTAASNSNFVHKGTSNRFSEDIISLQKVFLYMNEKMK